MNKGEISEQIVEYVRRNHNSRSDKLMELIAAYDGERAIAESQAPQPKVRVHLDCPKCGYYFEGWENPPTTFRDASGTFYDSSAHHWKKGGKE